MKYLIPISLLVLTSQSYAKSPCKTLPKCIEKVSKLTGDKYLYPSEMKETKVEVTDNFEIKKENANHFLSELLAYHGFTRIEKNKGDWIVINARDIRYYPTKVLTYGKDKIPNTHDHVLVNIKLKNRYLASRLSRNFRPFMSRYGRIIDYGDLGFLTVSDHGDNVHRLIKLVELFDKEPTADEIKEFKRKEKYKEKLKLIKAKVPKKEAS